jgi:hypothetical protein
MSDITIFPKYITIQAINHTQNYASRNGPTDVRFSKSNIDRYCYFEIIEQIKETNKLRFKIDNGNYVYTHGNDYVHSSNDYNYVKDKNTFELIKLENKGDNIYAIKSTNGNFVTIYDIDGEHKLKAVKTSIDKYCEFKIEEPIIKKEIININYDINNAVIKQTSPEIAARQYVENNSHDSSTISRLGYSYKKSETGTWNNTVGVELTLGMEFSAGIPFVADSTFKIEISSSYTHEWGGSKTIEKEINGQLEVSIPPRKKGTVSVIVSKALLDVPFTYTTKTRYLNGEIIEKNDVKGIYKNLESYLINGDTSELEDIK